MSEPRKINSYPKVLNIAHRLAKKLVEGGEPVYVQEKLDGSQFSFGVFDGVPFARSRNTMIDFDDPGMFRLGVESVIEFHERGVLEEGWTYRSEFISKPKHNVIQYDTTPDYYIVLYDIMVGMEDYMPWKLVQEIADLYLGCPFAPVYAEGVLGTGEFVLDEFLDKRSVLGGPIEGVVIKNPNVFGEDGKPLVGKYVSEKFKEVQNSEWKKQTKTKGNLVEQLIDKYASEARWQKAVQHLAERGELVNAPQDIGPLMKEVSIDFWDECAEEVAEDCIKFVRKELQRGVTKGLPEWYKDRIKGVL